MPRDDVVSFAVYGGGFQAFLAVFAAGRRLNGGVGVWAVARRVRVVPPGFRCMRPGYLPGCALSPSSDVPPYSLAA